VICGKNSTWILQKQKKITAYCDFPNITLRKQSTLLLEHELVKFDRFNTMKRSTALPTAFSNGATIFSSRYWFCFGRIWKL